MLNLQEFDGYSATKEINSWQVKFIEMFCIAKMDRGLNQL